MIGRGSLADGVSLAWFHERCHSHALWRHLAPCCAYTWSRRHVCRVPGSEVWVASSLPGRSGGPARQYRVVRLHSVRTGRLAGDGDERPSDPAIRRRGLSVVFWCPDSLLFIPRLVERSTPIAWITLMSAPVGTASACDSSHESESAIVCLRLGAAISRPQRAPSVAIDHPAGLHSCCRCLRLRFIRFPGRTRRPIVSVTPVFKMDRAGVWRRSFGLWHKAPRLEKMSVLGPHSGCLVGILVSKRFPPRCGLRRMHKRSSVIFCR